MDVASELNQDVVTDFPVLDAVGKLEPGIYVVTARPWKGAANPADANADESVQLAAQWMVVSDLGLTAISGDDGVHALVQSLGLRRAARRRRTQARCAQQRSAGDEDDRRRRPGRFRSRPLARQGRLGAGPSGRHARRRLRLPQPRPERFRPQRSRRRRPRSARRARRLPLHRARRLSLGRDRVRHGASARRQGRGEIRLAADARRQAAGRRRIQTRDLARPGPRRARIRRYRCCQVRRPANGRSRLTPIPRATASAGSSSCSRITFPSGSISRSIRRSPSSLPASRSNSRSTRGFSMARRRAGSTSPAPFGCRSSKARSSPVFQAMSPASPTMISPPSRTSFPTRFRPTTRATPICRSNCPKARARARCRRS